MNFFTILWSDDNKFDIQEHTELREAVIYLVKHGSEYNNQKIVQEYDWLPNNTPKIEIADGQPNEVVGPPPGSIVGPAEQPTVIGDTKPSITKINVDDVKSKPGVKRSIFDGIIPQNFPRQALNDD